jgi:uncharacterized protein YmfQ (DUF2313 family)
MIHKDALQLLFAIPLQGVSDADFYAIGAALDGAESRLNSLKADMFEDTVSADSVSRFEKMYGLQTDTGMSLSERRNRLIARRQQRGGCHERYYVSLASGRGYTITISPHVGTARFTFQLPAKLYDGGSLWSWTVTVHGVAGPVTDLENLLNDIKRAHTEITFVYQP